MIMSSYFKYPSNLAKRIQMIFCILVMIFMIGPIVSVIPISFSAGSFLSYPLPGWSFQWYEKIFAPSPWMVALKNSVLIGVVATILSTILGTLAAIGISRNNLIAQSFILGLIISPMIVPVIVTAVAMYFFLAKIGLVASFVGLVIAHTVLAVPFVVIPVVATLQGFDHSLVRAAASLGAKPLHAFRTVTLPVIAPGVASGAILAFATSFDEVVMAIFIAGPKQRTLPMQMFDGIRDSIDPSILAMSTVLVAVSTLMLVVVAMLTRKTGIGTGP